MVGAAHLYELFLGFAAARQTHTVETQALPFHTGEGVKDNGYIHKKT